MSITHSTTAIIVLSAASFATMAQTAADHAQHHPTLVAQAQTPPAKPEGAMAPRPGTRMPMPASAAMDERIKEMQAMHEKMANAKTQDERNALMAEHMKTMQAGMAMMNQMGSMGMGGGAGMHGGKAMPGNMADRYQMMEKRMDMMQSMMQMMMDRMPATPAK